MAHRIVYKEMSWPEIQARVRTCNIAIIPLGAMEQHVYHLPVGTVTFQAFAMARRGAERVADEVGAELLREMQAKSHLAGRYRPDAYKSGQP